MSTMTLTPSSKRTLVLLAIVLVLGGARSIMNWRSNQPRELPANPLATVDRTAVASVTLSRGTATVELVRADGTWRVAGIDDVADASMVSAFLVDLIGASVSRVAATDTSTLAPFYLDADQALSISLKDATGVSISELSLGAKDARSTYLLSKGGSLIYEIDANFAGVAPSPESWRSKAVLSLDTSAISEVELRGKKSFTLRKTGQTHVLLVGGKETAVSEDKVNAYLTSLANLTAAAFPKPEDVTGLDTPSRTILIRTADGQEIEVKVGGENALGDLFVKTNRRTTVLAVSAVDIKGIEEHDLEPDAPAPSAAPSPAPAG